jgi:hypothetical protein
MKRKHQQCSNFALDNSYLLFDAMTYAFTAQDPYQKFGNAMIDAANACKLQMSYQTLFANGVKRFRARFPDAVVDSPIVYPHHGQTHSYASAATGASGATPAAAAASSSSTKTATTTSAATNAHHLATTPEKTHRPLEDRPKRFKHVSNASEFFLKHPDCMIVTQPVANFDEIVDSAVDKQMCIEVRISSDSVRVNASSSIAQNTMHQLVKTNGIVYIANDSAADTATPTRSNAFELLSAGTYNLVYQIRAPQDSNNNNERLNKEELEDCIGSELAEKLCNRSLVLRIAKPDTDCFTIEEARMELKRYVAAAASGGGIVPSLLWIAEDNMLDSKKLSADSNRRYTIAGLWDRASTTLDSRVFSVRMLSAQQKRVEFLKHYFTNLRLCIFKLSKQNFIHLDGKLTNLADFYPDCIEDASKAAEASVASSDHTKTPCCCLKYLDLDGDFLKQISTTHANAWKVCWLFNVLFVSTQLKVELHEGEYGLWFNPLKNAIKAVLNECKATTTTSSSSCGGIGCNERKIVTSAKLEGKFTFSNYAIQHGSSSSATDIAAGIVSICKFYFHDHPYYCTKRTLSKLCASEEVVDGKRVQEHLEYYDDLRLRYFMVMRFFYENINTGATVFDVLHEYCATSAKELTYRLLNGVSGSNQLKRRWPIIGTASNIDLLRLRNDKTKEYLRTWMPTASSR